MLFICEINQKQPEKKWNEMKWKRKRKRNRHPLSKSFVRWLTCSDVRVSQLNFDFMYMCLLCYAHTHTHPHVEWWMFVYCSAFTIHIINTQYIKQVTFCWFNKIIMRNNIRFIWLFIKIQNDQMVHNLR